MAPIRLAPSVTTGRWNSTALIRLSSLVTIAPACSDFRGHGPVETDEAPCGGADAAPAVVMDMLERIVPARFTEPVVMDRLERMGTRRGGLDAIWAVVMDMLERIVPVRFSGPVVTTRPERMGRAAYARARGVPFIRPGPPMTTRGRNSPSLIRLGPSVTSTAPRPARSRSVRGSL